MIGWPGAVLVDGEVVATWRTKANGTKLTVAVQAFDLISRGRRSAIESEAADVAALRNRELTEVTFEGP